MAPKMYLFNHALFFLVFACNSIQVSSSSFDEFKQLFQPTTLPIDWNRSDIGRLGKPIYGLDTFNEISNEHFGFVPNNLINNNPNTSLRALFQLPSIGKLSLLILASDSISDYYGDGEPFPIKTLIYLVIYDFGGKILSYKQIGGSYVDNWDQSLVINPDHSFQTKQYIQLHENIIHPKKGYLIGKYKEFVETCKICNNGKIKCESTSRTGYFDLIDSKFEFVRF